MQRLPVTSCVIGDMDDKDSRTVPHNTLALRRSWARHDKYCIFYVHFSEGPKAPWNEGNIKRCILSQCSWNIFSSRTQLGPQRESRAVTHSHVARDHHFVYRALRCTCADSITGQRENPWSFLPAALRKGGFHASFLGSAMSSSPLDAQEAETSDIPTRQRLKPVKYEIFPARRWLIHWLIDDWNAIFSYMPRLSSFLGLPSKGLQKGSVIPGSFQPNF